MAKLLRIGDNSFIKGIDICYICNRKRCKKCSSARGEVYGYLGARCTHTFDPKYAVSTSGLFEYRNCNDGGNGVLWQYEIGK
jgi:hypothetical protein